MIARTYKRERIIYILSLFVIIPLGLATRKFPKFFPEFIAEYGGDTLYASMVYFLISVLLPAKNYWWRISFSIAFCFIIEISQLLHPHWLELIRQTIFGKLVLGAGFLWSDLICFLIGVLLAFGLDAVFLKSKNAAQIN